MFPPKGGTFVPFANFYLLIENKSILIFRVTLFVGVGSKRGRTDAPAVEFPRTKQKREHTLKHTQRRSPTPSEGHSQRREREDDDIHTSKDIEDNTKKPKPPCRARSNR